MAAKGAMDTILDRHDRMENLLGAYNAALTKIRAELEDLECSCRKPRSKDCVKCTIVEILDEVYKA